MLLENKNAVIYGTAGTVLLKRLPTLAEVADTTAFITSDQARAMTATVA